MKINFNYLCVILFLSILSLLPELSNNIAQAVTGHDPVNCLPPNGNPSCPDGGLNCSGCPDGSTWRAEPVCGCVNDNCEPPSEGCPQGTSWVIDPVNSECGCFPRSPCIPPAPDCNCGEMVNEQDPCGPCIDAQPPCCIGSNTPGNLEPPEFGYATYACAAGFCFSSRLWECIITGCCNKQCGSHPTNTYVQAIEYGCETGIGPFGNPMTVCDYSN